MVVLHAGDTSFHTSGFRDGKRNRLKLGPWVLTIYHEVWPEASSRRLTVVDCKHSAREVLNPVVLEITHIAAEILTHALIRILSLPICLRVISGGDLTLDLQAGTEMLPHCGDRRWPLIGPNGLKKPGIREHMVCEFVGSLFS
jgi:hypothetical protein